MPGGVAEPVAGEAVFELERFEWTADERIEVEGRWLGVRGRRFMRPSSRPLTKILPRVGRSSRIRSRTRLDLPAPEAPTRNTKSPSGMLRLMSRRASVPLGYRFQTCWKLITVRPLKSGAMTLK